MNTVSVYIAIILILFLSVSLWTSLATSTSESIAQRLKASLPLTLQVTICSLGYSVFFFVFTLAVGIAIWLILLGLVYLPADIMNNAFGKLWAENIVSSISPYVRRSSHTPGIFHQPILDYSTLCVLVLAPAAGIWSTLSRSKRRKGSHCADSVTTTRKNDNTTDIKKNAA